MRPVVLLAAALASTASAQVLAPWDSIEGDARRAVVQATANSDVVNRVDVSSVYFHRLSGFDHANAGESGLACGAAEMRSTDDSNAAFIVMYLLGPDGSVQRADAPALSDVATTSRLDVDVAGYCQQIVERMRRGMAEMRVIMAHE